MPIPHQSGMRLFTEKSGYDDYQALMIITSSSFMASIIIDVIIIIVVVINIVLTISKSSDDFQKPQKWSI